MIANHLHPRQVITDAQSHRTPQGNVYMFKDSLNRFANVLMQA